MQAKKEAVVRSGVGHTELILPGQAEASRLVNLLVFPSQIRHESCLQGIRNDGLDATYDLRLATGYFGAMPSAL